MRKSQHARGFGLSSLRGNRGSVACVELRRASSPVTRTRAPTFVDTLNCPRVAHPRRKAVCLARRLADRLTDLQRHTIRLPTMFAIASTAGLRAPSAARSARTSRTCTRRAVTVHANASEPKPVAPTGRRELFQKGAALAAFAVMQTTTPPPAFADRLPEETDVKLICDAACEEALKDIELVTTKSGLQYKDIKIGDGVQPEPGFQVVVDYIAKNEQGFIFDNSLEKGKPNDVRVTGDPTSCNVIPGLDEGILTMKSGGIRRMYIPGELAFPKGLASAPGRPRIAPFSPVVFDVKLIYIPGME